MASGSVVSKGSLVGRSSIIDSGTRLERSIIGSDCHIGRSTFLQGSCLHGGVRVDDSCRVSSSVLGEQVVVRAHARVEVRSGCATRRCAEGYKRIGGMSGCLRRYVETMSLWLALWMQQLVCFMVDFYSSVECADRRHAGEAHSSGYSAFCSGGHARIPGPA